MLFCCLLRYAKLLVINTSSSSPAINKLRRFTTSNKRHNLPLSGGAVLITRSRSQRWQHAMEQDIGSESRFMPIPLAFDAPVRGVPVGILPWCLVWKTVKKILKINVYSFLQNPRTWETDRQTDGRTPHDGICRAFIASCGNHINTTQYLYDTVFFWSRQGPWI